MTTEVIPELPVCTDMTKEPALPALRWPQRSTENTLWVPLWPWRTTCLIAPWTPLSSPLPTSLYSVLQFRLISCGGLQFHQICPGGLRLHCHALVVFYFAMGNFSPVCSAVVVFYFAMGIFSPVCSAVVVVYSTVGSSPISSAVVVFSSTIGIFSLQFLQPTILFNLWRHCKLNCYILLQFTILLCIVHST